MIHQHEPATDIKTLKYLEKQLAGRVSGLHHEKSPQKIPHKQQQKKKKTFRITYTNSNLDLDLTGLQCCFLLAH